MSRDYKNIIKKPHAYGTEERANLAKETVKDSTPMPKSLEYKDIDEAFKEWVENSLDVSLDDKRLPTIALFSNQRFSEYLQTWADVDDKKNLELNFKTITRENNPKGGSVVGSTRNIPGERTFLLKRVEARDRNGKKYYIDYRMKQPISIDLIYTVNIVTNRYEMLNTFNLMINDKFKAITAYIWPNGYPIAMNLNDISDESEYSIDDRLFYSQAYNIKVMAYIMPEDSFSVIERPELKFMGFEGDKTKSSYVDITEYPCNYFEELPENYKVIELEVTISPCDTQFKFELDCDFNVKKIEWDFKHFHFKMSVNDDEIPIESITKLKLKDKDIIKFYGFKRHKCMDTFKILLTGFDPTNLYDD